MQPVDFRSRTLRAFVVSLSLVAASALLTACVTPPVSGPAPTVEPGGESAAPTPAETDAAPDAQRGSNGTAVVSMAGQSFTFDLAMCSFNDEDVLVHGPGSDDDSGDVAYLDIDLSRVDSFLNGELRIDLGVDERFASSDEIFVGFVNPDHEYGYMVTGDASFELEVQLNVPHTGQSIGSATAFVDCE